MLAYSRRATTRLDEQLRAEAGMTLEEYDVIYQLSTGDRGGVRMTALASALLVAPSSCTRLVSRLTERGWVDRRADPDDGRAVVAALTPTGRRALARAAVSHLRGIEEVFGSRLSVAEARSLGRTLAKL